MMVAEWLYNKILSSTSITQYTTKVFNDYAPIGFNPPYIIYLDSIGFSRNWKIKSPVVSVKSVATLSSVCNALNGYVYSLFDTSTFVIQEKSSELCIESVSIVNSIDGRYDNTNKNWFSVTDILINYQ